MLLSNVLSLSLSLSRVTPIRWATLKLSPWRPLSSAGRAVMSAHGTRKSAPPCPHRSGVTANKHSPRPIAESLSFKPCRLEQVGQDKPQPDPRGPPRTPSRAVSMQGPPGSRHSAPWGYGLSWPGAAYWTAIDHGRLQQWRHLRHSSEERSQPDDGVRARNKC